MVKKVIFKLQGMKCGSCAFLIDTKLEFSGLIKSARTSYAKSQVEVEFGHEKVSEKEILTIICNAGYTTILLRN